MGTNTTDTSTIAYADLLRDESPVATRRRDLNIAEGVDHCELCGRAVKSHATAKVMAVKPNGTLVANTADWLDHEDADVLFVGADCARDIPALYLLDAKDVTGR